MPPSRLAVGIRVGLVTAATTAGVIVGLGWRQRAPFDSFLVAGRAVLSMTAGTFASPLVATVFGFVVHAIWMLLWGVCFSAVATPLRGIPRILAALAVTALAALLTFTIVPGALGAGAIAAQTVAQIVLLLILFAGSLVVGMRIARVE